MEYRRILDPLQVLPLCWCLMEKKTQPAYESVLQLIRARLPHYRFTKVVTDFEDAIINAFRNVFHGVEVQGCLFHAADVSVTQIWVKFLCIWLLCIFNILKVELPIFFSGNGKICKRLHWHVSYWSLLYNRGFY